MAGIIYQRANRPRVNYAATGDPAVSDDSTKGYGVGSAWFDVTHSREWRCYSGAAGAAVWQCMNPRKILASGGAKIDHTGDTVEFAMKTVTIPANSLGANGRIIADCWLSNNNNANNKVHRLRYSTISGTALYTVTLTTTITAHEWREITNANAENAQRYPGSGTPYTISGAVATATLAVDTSASTTLIFTGQLANSGDTISLDQCRVETWYVP